MRCHLTLSPLGLMWHGDQSYCFGLYTSSWCLICHPKNCELVEIVHKIEKFQFSSLFFPFLITNKLSNVHAILRWYESETFMFEFVPDYSCLTKIAYIVHILTSSSKGHSSKSFSQIFENPDVIGQFWCQIWVERKKVLRKWSMAAQQQNLVKLLNNGKKRKEKKRCVTICIDGEYDGKCFYFDSFTIFTTI